MLRLFDKLAHHCLVNSQAVKEMVIQKERVPESNITIIPNGLWNTTDAVTPTTREQAGLDESSQVVGVVANLRPVKRIDRFLQVASNILSKKRDTQFLILGQGELEDELRSMAKRLNIKGQVVFAGSVSDVRSHLSLIDVGVLTSESEGLSNSLIEYAVAGLPAVAFDVGGNKEVIIHNETGFLIPDGDVGAMSDCVCRLLTDANLHNHVSQRAREHANATFSSSRILELYMRFFSEYA